MSKLLNRTGFYLLFFIAVHAELPAQTFYFGNDLSYVAEMEECGANFKENGVTKDPYAIFKDHGCNLVRLRLWHTPSWYDALNLGNRYSDLEDVIRSSYRAKSLSMQVLLDFHLSDTWADPGHQVVPAAWAGVVDNLPALQDSLYQYIYSTLATLASANILPEMVQIGNETNKGILQSQASNDAGWSLDWPRNSALFNTAISAVRAIETAFGADIKVALHVANPIDADWLMQAFWDHGVRDFDVIGVSYYWQFHNVLFADLGPAISELRNSYPGKEVMIFETAYPWTSSNDDGANNILSSTYPGYSPATLAHQQQWLIDMTQTVIDHGGHGVIYWEPGWVSTGCWTQFGHGSNWDNATFFDFNTNLQLNGGIEWMTHQYTFTSAANDLKVDSISLQIYQADHEIIIQWSNERLLALPMDIEIITLDGKIVDKKTYSTQRGQNTFRLAIPNDVSGCFIVTCHMRGQIPVYRLFFQN